MNRPYTIELIFRGVNNSTGQQEWIPVVKADGVEILRGSIYRSDSDAFEAARCCYQLRRYMMYGADPVDIAR